MANDINLNFLERLIRKDIGRSLDSKEAKDVLDLNNKEFAELAESKDELDIDDIMDDDDLLALFATEYKAELDKKQEAKDKEKEKEEENKVQEKNGAGI